MDKEEIKKRINKLEKKIITIKKYYMYIASNW